MPDPVALLDLLAAQLDVLGGGALEGDHGGRPAHDLLGGRRRALALVELPLVGVGEEGVHAVADGVAGRLVARDRQQEHEEAELVGGEVALVLGGDQLW